MGISRIVKHFCTINCIFFLKPYSSYFSQPVTFRNCDPLSSDTSHFRLPVRKTFIEYIFQITTYSNRNVRLHKCFFLYFFSSSQRESNIFIISRKIKISRNCIFSGGSQRYALSCYILKRK